MKAFARELSFAVATLALIAGVVMADDKKPQKKPDGQQGKVIVLKIDASKLSPDVLKQLMQAAGGDVKKPDGDKKPGEKKPGGDKKPGEGDKKPDGDKKQFTLSAAIAVAEKHAQGTAVKAEYAGNGFAVEVKTSKGSVTIKLDSTGNVAGDKKPDGDKKPETKPNKPNKNKKKNEGR